LIKDRLIEANAVKFGDFILSSDKKSNYYVDIKGAITNPFFLSEIATEISKRVSSKKIAGIELGVVPLLTATSLQLGIPFIIIRKDFPKHGMEEQIIGNVSHGECIDIIEDVITTGKSVLKAVELLRRKGAKISKVICVVDREGGGRAELHNNGLELFELVKVSELIKLKR
jgi:orotate phosphoribosyltransferase